MSDETGKAMSEAIKYSYSLHALTLPSTTNYIARAHIDETRTVGESINKVSNAVLPEARG